VFLQHVSAIASHTSTVALIDANAIPNPLVLRSPDAIVHVSFI
jgi:hypothetical protein